MCDIRTELFFSKYKGLILCRVSSFELIALVIVGLALQRVAPLPVTEFLRLCPSLSGLVTVFSRSLRIRSVQVNKRGPFFLICLSIKYEKCISFLLSLPRAVGGSAMTLQPPPNLTATLRICNHHFSTSSFTLRDN